MGCTLGRVAQLLTSVVKTGLRPPPTHTHTHLERARHNLFRHVGVAVGLFQLRSRDPDRLLGGQRLARSVEHLLGVLVRLQARERKPQVNLREGAGHVRGRRGGALRARLSTFLAFSYVSRRRSASHRPTSGGEWREVELEEGWLVRSDVVSRGKWVGRSGKWVVSRGKWESGE
eukprot:365585-Chlamydomonas_euryale.AAC.2